MEAKNAHRSSMDHGMFYRPNADTVLHFRCSFVKQLKTVFDILQSIKKDGALIFTPTTITFRTESDFAKGIATIDCAGPGAVDINNYFYDRHALGEQHVAGCCFETICKNLTLTHSSDVLDFYIDKACIEKNKMKFTIESMASKYSYSLFVQLTMAH